MALIIAGKLYVDPRDRDRFIEGHRVIVERAREQPGCLNLAISPDPTEAGRVNSMLQPPDLDGSTPATGACTNPGGPACGSTAHAPTSATGLTLDRSPPNRAPSGLPGYRSLKIMRAAESVPQIIRAAEIIRAAGLPRSFALTSSPWS